MRDRETGISIRFIREFKPDRDIQINSFDVALLSCRWLGHTWLINEHEQRCNVCGAVRVNG